MILSVQRALTKQINHKNPFTKGYKQAIHRKSTKTFKYETINSLTIEMYVEKHSVIFFFFY